jgi:eukaryotic-like serine/threonine-protein kinase
MALRAKTKLGRYEILSLLGGMGEVYAARDGRLEPDVAVKVMPTSFASDPARLHSLKTACSKRSAPVHC